MGKISSNIRIGATDHFVVCSQGLDGLRLKKCFIKTAIGKTYRKGAELIVEILFYNGGCIRAVKTTAQITPYGYIRTKANPASVLKESFQFFLPFNEGSIAISVMGKVEPPVTPYFYAMAAKERITGRHELIDALERSMVSCH
jgi:hypothetical protein